MLEVFKTQRSSKLIKHLKKSHLQSSVACPCKCHHQNETKQLTVISNNLVVITFFVASSS